MKPHDRLRLAWLFALTLGYRGAFAGKAPPRAGAATTSRFVVYYGTADVPELYDHDLAVLDSDVSPSILRKFGAGTTLLGYLSLGEAHQGRRYADELDRQGLLLARNANWPDARFIDVRDARWTTMVVNDLVPAILARGFRGLFIDTLDSCAHLEQQDPTRFAGMTRASGLLVRAIRRAFPRMPIMVNRGYAVLGQIASEIDMVLGESVHTTYDAATRSYVRVAPADVRWQLDRLQEVRRLAPSVRLFSLDYWSPDDAAGLASVYAEARANSLVPYVATIDLSRVIPRP